MAVHTETTPLPAQAFTILSFRVGLAVTLSLKGAQFDHQLVNGFLRPIDSFDPQSGRLLTITSSEPILACAAMRLLRDEPGHWNRTICNAQSIRAYVKASARVIYYCHTVGHPGPF